MSRCPCNKRRESERGTERETERDHVLCKCAVIFDEVDIPLGVELIDRVHICLPAWVREVYTVPCALC